MKDFSAKKAVLGGISVLAALMSLLALLFTLTVGVENESYFGVYIDVLYSENGISMLDFSSPLISKMFQWGAIAIGMLSYLQLIGSVALLILNLVGIFCFSRRASGAASAVGTIVPLVFDFLYMLEGIIFTAINNGAGTAIGVNGKYATFAFLPFIFSVLIAVAYFVCKFTIKEKKADATEENTPLWELPAEPAASPMPSDKVDALVMNFRNFIPEEQWLAFREVLSRAGEEKYPRICMVPVKNPTTVLLFSVFLGGWGIDRFYIGDTELGVAKLLVGWLTFGIWPLVDIFFCYKKAKEDNLKMLLNSLH